MNTNVRRRALAAGALACAAAAALTGCAIAAAAASADQVAGASPASVPVTFEWRTLGPMSGEPVPPYVCPSDKPFLAPGDHASFGDALIAGVEVDYPADLRRAVVTVTKAQTDQSGRPVGISSDPVVTSATNWSDQQTRYRIILHCVGETAAESAS